MISLSLELLVLLSKRTNAKITRLDRCSIASLHVPYLHFAFSIQTHKSNQLCLPASSMYLSHQCELTTSESECLPVGG